MCSRGLKGQGPSITDHVLLDHTNASTSTSLTSFPFVKETQIKNTKIKSHLKNVLSLVMLGATFCNSTELSDMPGKWLGFIMFVSPAKENSNRTRQLSGV